MKQIDRDEVLRPFRDADREVALGGFLLHVPANCFPPDFGFTTKKAAELLSRPPYATLEHAFDMGTGSGHLGLSLLKAGVRQVTAIDNHEPAVDAATVNFLKYPDLTHSRGTVVNNNLFDGLYEDRPTFDGGVFNQPFYQSEAGLLGLDVDVPVLNRKFLTQCLYMVRPGGPVMMNFASLGGSENDPRPIAKELGFGYVEDWAHTEGDLTFWVFTLLTPRS